MVESNRVNSSKDIEGGRLESDLSGGGYSMDEEGKGNPLSNTENVTDDGIVNSICNLKVGK